MLVKFRADQVTCFSAPGRDLAKNGRGQSLIMFSGAGGCMDNKRDIMKVLANVLGLRNEFLRPDRDNFILVQPQNFRAGMNLIDFLIQYNIFSHTVLMIILNQLFENSFSNVDLIICQLLRISYYIS